MCSRSISSQLLPALLLSGLLRLPPLDSARRGERRTIAARLHKLLVARYVEGYTKAVAAGKYISKKTKKVINEVPGALRAEQLSVSACEDRSRELKAMGFEIKNPSLRGWRPEYEAQAAAAAVPDAAPSAAPAAAATAGKRKRLEGCSAGSS